MRLTQSLTALALAGASLAVPVAVRAERLPIKVFTTADGLAHNVIYRIVRDSRGFLWFATEDGLSRFDGYGFRNYSVEHGLPHRTVMDILETRSGDFWIATWDGLVRFNPAGIPDSRIVSVNDVRTPPAMFAVLRPDDRDSRTRGITSLVEARDGSIWCGTRKGVYRLERTGGRWSLRPIDFGMRTDSQLTQYVHDLLEDRAGSMWAATSTGLYKRSAEGVTQSERPETVTHEFLDLYEDRKGHLWAGSKNGLFRLNPDGGRDLRVLERYTSHDGVPSDWVLAVRETSDGRWWLATAAGLVEWVRDAEPGEPRFRAYGRRNGLTHHVPTKLGEDAAGNLWIGTEGMGAMRLARQGFTTFDETDGLVGAFDVFEDRRGSLYTYAVRRLPTAAENSEYLFARIHDRRLEWFKPPQPFAFGCCGSNIAWSADEWWLAGDRGVYRLVAADDFISISAGRVVKIHESPEIAVTRFLTDSRGDIWMAMAGPDYGVLKVWQHATGTLQDLTQAPGLPPLTHQLPRAFAEDSRAAVWIGLDTGAARYKDGRFTFFSTDRGLPAGRIRAIYPDDRGHVWLASTQAGLIRVDDGASEQPRFETYTTAQGLSGNSIEAITGDTDGRIYAATGRGIDRLDPSTGAVEHFTADDGVLPSAVVAAFRDRTGTLWFATGRGLLQFTPAPNSAAATRTILVTGLTVGGVPRPISAIGETNLTLPDLGPGAKRLEIDFVALGSRSTEGQQYQDRLEGSGSDWSPPTSRRSVNFESLAPGHYRFVVRAVNAEGASGAAPATVTFTVLPPFWQRWWFLTLTVLALAGTAVGAHRYRLARALELERLRTRIAMDLHDDIGANLTRIAILSEVARRPASTSDGRHDAPLASIGTIAREAATSMSDIVWAISPGQDTLKDVVRRMRHHAGEIFDGGDVEMTLDVPDEAESMTIDIDVRRDFYLIFKEAVNNAARHSRCRRIAIVLRAAASQLTLEVADDGIGFDTTGDRGGNGLASMRRRANGLGGSLEVTSTAGAGTTIRLTMPFVQPRRTGG
jgi:signal transduction histidine kinase/ligand-binding sensor domain-containing protein